MSTRDLPITTVRALDVYDEDVHMLEMYSDRYPDISLDPCRHVMAARLMRDYLRGVLWRRQGPGLPQDAVTVYRHDVVKGRNESHHATLKIDRVLPDLMKPIDMSHDVVKKHPKP